MSEKELADLWQKCKSFFSASVDSTVYNLWFSDTSLRWLDNDFAVIAGPDTFRIGILEKTDRFSSLISTALRDLSGKEPELLFVSEQNGKPDVAALIDDAREKRNSSFSANPAVSSSGGEKEERFLNLGYTFDNFIAGSSNKFAKAAAMAVAEAPARDYNPLFIYGPSGLGKTHLLYATVNRMREKDPDMKIKYVKCEDFLNQLIDSIRHNTNSAFREKFRNNDVLLIDDIQFLAGKVSVQEEFFNTFNDLYEAQKQIIITSDRMPKEIEPLEERIQSRFEWGLVADITPPDFELRVAILRDKSERMGVSVPDEILSYIAEGLTGNIRQLEGALKRLTARAALTGEPITMETAHDCLTVIRGADHRNTVTPEAILDRVSRKYGVTQNELKSKSRIKKIAYARHVAIFLMRKITPLSFNDIASLFQRDHTTIISSNKYIEDEIKVNSITEMEINDLISELTN